MERLGFAQSPFTTTRWVKRHEKGASMAAAAWVDRRPTTWELFTFEGGTTQARNSMGLELVPLLVHATVEGWL